MTFETLIKHQIAYIFSIAIRHQIINHKIIFFYHQNPITASPRIKNSPIHQISSLALCVIMMRLNFLQKIEEQYNKRGKNKSQSHF